MVLFKCDHPIDGSAELAIAVLSIASRVFASCDQRSRPLVPLYSLPCHFLVTAPHSIGISRHGK
jgi:hypothetical protein